MKKSEILQLAEMEKTYWWHTGRKSIIHDLLKTLPLNNSTNIIHIGCGTGGSIHMLEKYGHVVNYDVSDDAVRLCRDNGFDQTHLYNGATLPCPDNSFDLAVSLDVLEHIEDDHTALKDWARVLKPGGRLVITVPAYPWLWSSHDEALGHYRRYTASEIHKKLNLAGFEVTKRSYTITLTFPLILGYRLLDSLRPSKKTPQASYVLLPKPINSFLSAILKLEGKMLRFINFPLGTSVLIVAKKIDKSS